MALPGFLKRHTTRIALSLSLLLLLLLSASRVLDWSFMQRLENYAYDLRLESTMPKGLDPRIIIVDINEQSLLEQGQWPWPRHKVAKLVDRLFDQYKVDVLGFDIVFAERDVSSGLKNLEALARADLSGNADFKLKLGQLRKELDYDQVFADSLKGRRVALGYYFRHDGKNAKTVGSLPEPVLSAELFNPADVAARVADGYSANLPELQASALAAGFFNASPLIDADGVVRRISLLQMYQGALYETLGLAVARLALREPGIELGYAGGDRDAVALESIQLGKRRIPADAQVAALIPYRGRQGSFPYVSASDVLNGRASAEVLRGAIVLLGTTAPGLNDLRATPMQDVYAGVEAHANVVAGILDGNIKDQPAYTLGLEISLLLVLGVMLALALPALAPLWATALFVATLLGATAFNLYLWKVANLALPLSSTLVLVVALYVFNMSYGFFVESRGKRSLARLFGQYVPPELVDEMAIDPGAYTLEGESRELTVMFSDVRGFTSISEGLDPKQLTHLMNEFLTPMTHVIHHHRGTIDKYMGDAIMAFWGAPLHDPQHGRNALLAALEMIERLESLQGQFKAKGWPPIRIGVGLNTGEMTVGNMGSEFRLAYTVMGDAVNLGSRLESLTKEYGVQIMVSESTRAAVTGFAFRELDCVRVKGKDKPVGIFEPICLLEQATPALLQELAQYAEALACYRAQNWSLAQEQFAALQRLHPERYLFEVYAKRIDHFLQFPPEAPWDGAYTFTTK